MARLIGAETPLTTALRVHRVPASHRRVLLRRWLAPTRTEIAAYARRPEIAETTPTSWPPGLRLMLFHARQITRLASHIARASYISTSGAPRFSATIRPPRTCHADPPNQQPD